MVDLYETVASWLRDSGSSVAFTGAGISTESGIPDFRSPGGVWSKSKPVYFEEFLNSGEARYEYWRQKAESHQDFVQAKPNAAHQILAKWESEGMLRGVITQNIDGMHQEAGSRNVLELHGTAREVMCLSCGVRYDADSQVSLFVETDAVPACVECGGLLKHATVSFGQQLPTEVLERSSEWCRDADLMLAMGSSLVVHPAAALPELAKRGGARLVIINRDPTPLDEQADIVLNEGLGATLEQIDALVDRHV